MEGFDFVKTLQIIISTLTLILGFLGYKKFIARQAITKQIDNLSDLINDIQSTKIQLKHNTVRTNNKGAYHIEFLTLFEIGNIYRMYKYEKDKVNLKKLEEKGILKYKEDKVFPFVKYVFNPLTPPKIADCLAMFMDSDKPTWCLLWGNYPEEIKEGKKDHFTFIEVMSESSKSEYFEFCVKNKDEVIRKEFQAFSSNAKALNNFLTLSKCAHELEREISRWFQKIGIEDINIRLFDSLDNL